MAVAILEIEADIDLDVEFDFDAIRRAVDEINGVGSVNSAVLRITEPVEIDIFP